MISRRALGLGLLGVSVAVTTGVVVTRTNPQLLTSVGLGEGQRLTGFAGGEKAGLLRNARLAALLRQHAGVSAEATVAGGVEQSRDEALLGRRPGFLWPGSDILADLARQNSGAVRQSQVVARSPIVFHSWPAVAQALVAAGLASVEGGITYVDTAAFVAALADEEAWAALPAPAGGGPLRIRSAQPHLSASGMHFAGMIANALCVDVATAAALTPHRAAILRLFERMGRKPANAKQLFDEYVAAGPGGAPMVVGYESQHLEWVLGDPARAGRADGPVMLYPRPTLMAAHAFISLNEGADRLLSVLQRPDAQAIAWSEHGLRAPADAPAGQANPAVASRIAQAPALLPLPDPGVLIGLIDAIGGRRAPASAGPPAAYTNEPFTPYR